MLLVILSHLSNHHAYVVFANFSGAGKYGVYLFFVLSAFLLTGQFLSKTFAVSFSRYELLNYFFRRFLRIYPLYIMVLMVSWLTTRFLSSYLRGSGFPYSITAPEFLRHLLLWQGKSVLWSVPVEFKYYFLLPVIALGFFLLRKRTWLLVGSTTITAVLCQWFLSSAVVEGNSIELTQYLPVFLMGSLCALVVKDADLSSVPPVCFNVMSYLPLLVVLLLLPGYEQRLPYAAIGNYLIRNMLFWGTVFSLFILSLYRVDSHVKRALCSRPMTYLGQISFSVYLLHVPLINAVMSVIHQPFIGGLVAIMVFLLASSLSFLLVERPLFRLHLSDLSSKTHD